ncbi:MAG TPA: hypothetical protein DEA22_05085, partial [Blastocatellia bacterium]|nr:hypothetical protein [Blastocatellia bacterium]
MNRNNLWINIIIAVVLITFAAVLGQIHRWRSALLETNTLDKQAVEKPKAVKRSSNEAEPEVLVRFRSNISMAEVKKLAGRYNDNVEDSLEIVSGLVAIDDLDNADAESVARQYASLTDVVEYAQPNYQIDLGNPEYREVTSRSAEVPGGPSQPNDEYFGDQWALNNQGQNGGKAKADIDAVRAWSKT